MNQTARIISIYAADTSGFCSALYEYGGMTVIHDASGCNSTYTTHDEPRWYQKDSMMYISGLTESDAVMGNDEKFINDLCLAADELHPAFIAVCASALPAMVGVDMEAIAYEVESRTGIPSFEVKTNAMQSYITGAGNAFLELVRKFSDTEMENQEKIKEPSSVKVNVLGLTPLDFPLDGTVEKIKCWLKKEGLEINSLVGMDTDLDHIRRLSQGNVNLVVASTGKPLAEYLYREYGIPYVIGTPYGVEFSKYLADALREAIKIKKNMNAPLLCRTSKKNFPNVETSLGVDIIGESILSASLAAAIYLEKGINTRVIESVGEGDMSVLLTSEYSGEDISCQEESSLEKVVEKSKIVIADPLFEPICHGKRFIRIPHMAFSGRCFKKEEKQLINVSLSEIII